MALSEKAQEIRDMLISTNARAFFNEREAFEDIIEKMRALQAKGASIPESFYEKVDIEEFETSGGAKCFTFSPKGEPKNDCHLIYYHGGGFLMELGDMSWNSYVRIVEKLGCSVTVPSYRQCPTWTWKETYADSLDAYKHVLETVPAEKIAFMGESAGGHLVLAVALLAKMEGLPQPGLLIPMSPWGDMANELEGKAELAEKDVLLGWISMDELPKMWAPDKWDNKGFPVNLLYADYEGIAPCLVIAGGDEMLLPDADIIVGLLEEAGVPVDYMVYEGMWHAFVGMPEIPECVEAWTICMDRIAAL